MSTCEWLKLPGLFHRSELEEVLEAGGEHVYVFSQAGHDHQGRELVAVYCRERSSGDPELIDLSRPRPVAAARAASEGGAE